MLEQTFGDKVLFVGLQGSYARGEATKSSDIDTVVILDQLSTDDILKYDQALNTLPYRELICGFISGKDEILNWSPADLFQFYHDTKPLIGTLDNLIPNIDGTAVDDAIKLGVCNIYHGCVHNMLHEKSSDILCGLYKSASFTIQAIHFKESGNYVSLQKELLKVVSREHRAIIDTAMKLKIGENIDFKEASNDLFEWSKKLI
jgi:hypothetical protein